MMRSIKKILVDQERGTRYDVKDLTEDFHTTQGVISSQELSSKKREVQSSSGRKFLLITPGFSDLWQSLVRGPQIMQQKDIGLILAKTGVNRNSLVVDAGGGSGSLCFSLANVAKHVTVYEVNPEHYDLLQKNAQMFAMPHLTLKQENIYNGIAEKNIDLLTLDLPEPWRVIEHAEIAVTSGGYIVVYLPNLTQIKTFIDLCEKSTLRVLETVELLQRAWKIEGKIMRPEFEMLGHTGFMVFCRKF